MAFGTNLENKMSISFMAKTENVMFARNTATTFLYYLNPTISFLNEIKTIISEGVTNAIIHGYQSEEKMEVLLNMGYDKTNIYIEIIDDGIGIENITEAMMPMYSNDKTGERSGLGFTIMEVFSDFLEVESEKGRGTKVKITKKIIGDKFE